MKEWDGQHQQTVYVERMSDGRSRTVVEQERSFDHVHQVADPDFLRWYLWKKGLKVRAFAAQTGLPLNEVRAALKLKGSKGHRPMHLKRLDAIQRIDPAWKSNVAQDVDFPSIYARIAGTPTGELLRPYKNFEWLIPVEDIPVLE